MVVQNPSSLAPTEQQTSDIKFRDDLRLFIEAAKRKRKTAELTIMDMDYIISALESNTAAFRLLEMNDKYQLY